MFPSIALAGWVHQCGPELTNREPLVQADRGFEVYSLLQLIQPMVYRSSHVVDLVSSNATTVGRYPILWKKATGGLDHARHSRLAPTTSRCCVNRDATGALQLHDLESSL